MSNRFRRAISVCLALCFAGANALHAQNTLASVFAPQPFLPASAIIPVPGSKLNYTDVMFDHPPVNGAVVYQLIINETSGDSPWKTIDVRDSSCSTLVKKLIFGKSYKWNYVALSAKGKQIFTSPEYTFSVLPLPARNRIRVVSNETGNQGGYVSFDHHCLIVDRKGTPVWFLPSEFSTQPLRGGEVSDISVTSAGTITFVSKRCAFEIIPDGRTTWRFPQSDADARDFTGFHDCVQRLPNGNRMTLGTLYLERAVPFENRTVPVPFGYIAEYNQMGALVWLWESHNYLRPAEPALRQLPSGQWTSNGGLNAFEQVTESGVDYVYASFGDLNRIVKIEKPGGKVVATYGRRMDSGYGWKDDKLFAVQHDVTPLSDGNIAVFSNDSVTKEAVVSSVVIFSPGANGEEPKLVWRFACDFDRATNGKSTNGGSVDELPNKNLLVNFGELGYCVEIGSGSKVVWSAFAESKSGDSAWTVAPQGRSHYVASLYPVWFSVAMLSNTKKTSSVSIFNEGEAADSYAVEYLVNGKWISLASVELQPGKHTNCMIPKVKTAPFTKIRVVSAHNPDFVRTISLE